MKHHWKILLVIVFAAILFSGASVFGAEETKTPPTYTLLQPLPGMNQTMPVKAILPAYLTVLFKFMLALAGILAVLMIVFAGIMYITSGGNASQVEKAKSRIWSAIGGLVLAISAYLILYTINPNLVNLDLGIQPIKIQKFSAESNVNAPDFTLPESNPCVAGRTQCQRGLYCKEEGYRPVKGITMGMCRPIEGRVVYIQEGEVCTLNNDRCDQGKGLACRDFGASAGRYRYRCVSVTKVPSTPSNIILNKGDVCDPFNNRCGTGLSCLLTSEGTTCQP